jgi:hypothetical protein
MPCRWIYLALAVLFLGLTSGAAAQDKKLPPEQVQFFENKVRPLLAENCFRCHGEEKQKGELRLDSLAGMLEGGKGGPALVPGQPDRSRMIDAVHYRKGLEMPPSKKLSKTQIETLEQWVKMGAPWPGADPKAPPSKAKKDFTITKEDRQFWSFKPISRPKVPVVPGVQHPVDAFIHQKLQARGLKPSPPATKLELLRRVYFDLIGLPPTPEEVDAYLKDQSPDAYEKMIDKLLARPQYASPRPTATSATAKSQTPGCIVIMSSAPSTRTSPTTSLSWSRLPGMSWRRSPTIR